MFLRNVVLLTLIGETEVGGEGHDKKLQSIILPNGCELSKRNETAGQIEAFCDNSDFHRGFPRFARPLTAIGR